MLGKQIFPRHYPLTSALKRLFDKGWELRPDPSREWARCSVSKQREMDPFRRHVMSLVQVDSRGPYSNNVEMNDVRRQI